MSFSDMKLVRQWRVYAGPKDERLEAENCRIYRIGFLLLSFGVLIFLLYEATAKQVAWVHDNFPAHPGVFVSPSELVLLVWFIATMVVCCALQSRKGFVETNRFGQTDVFPMGYFSIIAALSGAASAVVIAALRCIAELQIVSTAEVFWAANCALGLLFGAVVFAFTLLGFYLQFKSAKKYRERIDDTLGE